MSQDPEQQQQPESPTPPLPGEASPARKDQIDPKSADAKSVAPSDGTGLSGTVEAPHPVEPPPPDEQSWMQDA